MAKISVDSKTSTSITVYLDELDTNYSYNNRYIEWYVDEEGTKPDATTTIGAYASKSNTATLKGLSPNTTYTIIALVYVSGDLSPFASFTKSVTTEKATPTRPSKFGWDKSIVEQGKDAIIYASDWNDLTANINEVRAYKSLSSYSFTTAVKGNDFTAIMYNEAVKAIKGISGYGTYLSEVSKGDKVTAKRLNDLVSEINAVP